MFTKNIWKQFICSKKDVCKDIFCPHSRPHALNFNCDIFTCSRVKPKIKKAYCISVIKFTIKKVLKEALCSLSAIIVLTFCAYWLYLIWGK